MLSVCLEVSGFKLCYRSCPLRAVCIRVLHVAGPSGPTWQWSLSYSYSYTTASSSSGHSDAHAHIGQSPAYVIDAVTPVSQEPSRNGLYALLPLLTIIPRTRTKLGERTFGVSGPTTWNSLHESLRAVDCNMQLLGDNWRLSIITYICVDIFSFSLLWLLYCRSVPAECRPDNKHVMLVLMLMLIHMSHISSSVTSSMWMLSRAVWSAFSHPAS